MQCVHYRGHYPVRTGAEPRLFESCSRSLQGLQGSKRRWFDVAPLDDEEGQGGFPTAFLLIAFCIVSAGFRVEVAGKVAPGIWASQDSSVERVGKSTSFAGGLMVALPLRFSMATPTSRTGWTHRLPSLRTSNFKEADTTQK